MKSGTTRICQRTRICMWKPFQKIKSNWTKRDLSLVPLLCGTHFPQGPYSVSQCEASRCSPFSHKKLGIHPPRGWWAAVAQTCTRTLERQKEMPQINHTSFKCVDSVIVGCPYPAGHSAVLISSQSSCSQDGSPESSASEEALSGKLLQCKLQYSGNHRDKSH